MSRWGDIVVAPSDRAYEKPENVSKESSTASDDEAKLDSVKVEV